MKPSILDPTFCIRAAFRPWWLFWIDKNAWVTMYPYIYFPKHVNPEAYPNVLAHERRHLIQQQAMGLKQWLYRYATDHKFKLQQEAQAIACEIGATPWEPAKDIARRYAVELSNEYRTPIFGKPPADSYAEAYAAIETACREFGVDL